MKRLLPPSGPSWTATVADAPARRAAAAARIAAAASDAVAAAARAAGRAAAAAVHAAAAPDAAARRDRLQRPALPERECHRRRRHRHLFWALRVPLRLREARLRAVAAEIRRGLRSRVFKGVDVVRVMILYFPTCTALQWRGRWPATMARAESGLYGSSTTRSFSR